MRPIGRRPVLALLAGATAGTSAVLSGCSLFDRGGTDAVAPADLDTLRSVAGDSLGLADRYEQAIAQAADQAARLAPIRDAHREHAAAIARSLGASASAPSRPGDGPAGLRGLQEAERSAAERAATACVAVAAHHAPLLGAIAAARASHAEALS